jgi:general secretion pathway protein M
MKEWWLAREPRERLLLMMAALLVLATLVYSSVWQPLTVARDGALVREQAQRETLAWMRQAAAEARQLQARGQVQRDSGRSLLSEVQQAAAGSPMAAGLKQLNPEGSGRLRVSVEAVDFASFIRWLDKLAAAGVQVRSLNLSRTEQGATQVQARLLLER